MALLVRILLLDAGVGASLTAAVKVPVGCRIPGFGAVLTAVVWLLYAATFVAAELAVLSWGLESVS